MLHSEEYYYKLSLPAVPSTNIKVDKSYRFQKFQESDTENRLKDIIAHISGRSSREKLRDAFQKMLISWGERHDNFVQMIDELETNQKKLKAQLQLQSQYYDRAVKESQHYKFLYENMRQQQRNINSSKRRSLLLSNHNNSPKSASSCASSIRSSYVDEFIDPILFDHQSLLVDSDNEDNSIPNNDLYSIFSDTELPLSPAATPLLSPLSLKSNLNETHQKLRPETQQELFFASPHDTITFGCGDSFWNSISNGRTNKTEVDTLIHQYLAKGGNPNIASRISSATNTVKEGYGLVHALISTKNTTSLQKLLDAGANPNAIPITSKRENKVSPLVLAAKLGYMNGVRLLIERGGVDVMNSKGPYGENALHAAIQSESDELVGYILRICKNQLLEKTDNNGATPLHYACITGRNRLITLFIRDCHSKPNPKDNKGETPLHYAVRNNKLKVVAKLVTELGVDPNPYVSNQVPTPLDLAKAAGLKTIAEYLKRVGAKRTKHLEKC